MKNLFIITFLFLFGCSVDEKFVAPKKPQPIDKLYPSAINDFKKGEWSQSIEKLKQIHINYPYSEFAPQSILMIAYIYYESNEYILSLETIKKFKEFYPAHKNIDYADFLIGICLYEQIETVARNQQNTHLALKQFKKIVKKYPNSPYAEESELRIDLINEQLAGKEMYIARYYIKRKKWTAAILRLQNIIKKYDNTIFIDEALHRMVEVNYYFGNISEAKKYAAILGYNYNDSDWYKKSYRIVGKKNYKTQNEKEKNKIKKKLLDFFKFQNDKKF
jgi:outer membrane protein assembly factor BamD